MNESHEKTRQQWKIINHRCKLCSREFSNGKALGAHIRFHVLMINLPPAETEDSMVLQDDGAEEEPSAPPPRCRRSKRRRLTKPRVISSFPAMGAAGESSPVSSSVTDSSPEEDGAHCLILLSRDHWINRGEEDDEKDEGQNGEYRCESCGRVFRSYQALGGHRASHKKKKKKKEKMKGKFGNSGGDQEMMIKNTHECPLCERVFSSGQALGGHEITFQWWGYFGLFSFCYIFINCHGCCCGGPKGVKNFCWNSHGRS